MTLSTGFMSIFKDSLNENWETDDLFSSEPT